MAKKNSARAAKPAPLSKQDKAHLSRILKKARAFKAFYRTAKPASKSPSSKAGKRTR